MQPEGMFKHQCIHPDCEQLVGFDDEPWCFTHSPDEGSSLAGFSARKALEEATKLPLLSRGFSQSNVFDNKTED